jgi:hypothetical protein
MERYGASSIRAVLKLKIVTSNVVRGSTSQRVTRKTTDLVM